MRATMLASCQLSTSVWNGSLARRISLLTSVAKKVFTNHVCQSSSLRLFLRGPESFKTYIPEGVLSSLILCVCASVFSTGSSPHNKREREIINLPSSDLKQLPRPISPSKGSVACEGLLKPVSILVA